MEGDGTTQGDHIIGVLRVVRGRLKTQALKDFIDYLLADPAQRISAMRAVMSMLFLDDPQMLVEMNLHVAQNMAKERRMRDERMGGRRVDPRFN